MTTEKLKQYSQNDTLSAIIRHADRDKIPTDSFGNEILLNKKGIYNSIVFGKEIKNYTIKRIFTSPIQRCVQTAEFIAEGYGKKFDIIKSPALGDPGYHITDAKKAGEIFLNIGGMEMLKRFTADIPMEGVQTHKNLKENMDNFIKENTDEQGLTLFITHDMLIAFYHYCIDKTVYTKQNWVNYLSGIIFKNGIYEK
jgi:broad specificity phosphatase PhoE